jgi:hypothetical protein
MSPTLRTFGRGLTCVCIAALLATSSVWAQRTPVDLPAAAARGDLAGSYPNPSVAKIQNTAVSPTVPSAGQVLTFDGRAWAPATASAGGVAPCPILCVLAFGRVQGTPSSVYGPRSCKMVGPRSANVTACSINTISFAGDVTFVTFKAR